MADRDPLPAAVQPDRLTARRTTRGGSPPGLDAIERRIGHRFAEKALLREALTHSSAAGRGRRSNERLEFLGDRVLGLAVADLLIKFYRGRARRRSDAATFRAGQRAGAGRGGARPRVGRLARRRQERGGRWAGASDPAILADAFEALIGAIYLDGGWEAAASVVRSCLEPRLEMMTIPPRDAKSGIAGVDAEPRPRPARLSRDRDLRPGARAHLRGGRVARGPWLRPRRPAAPSARPSKPPPSSCWLASAPPAAAP